MANDDSRRLTELTIGEAKRIVVLVANESDVLLPYRY